jgi:TonB family protein
MALAIPACAAGARPVKSRVPPVYAEIAKRLRIEGSVSVEATVDFFGKVSDVKTLSGNHALAASAEDAVRKWRFLSAPDHSTVLVEINFAQ